MAGEWEETTLGAEVDLLEFRIEDRISFTRHPGRTGHGKDQAGRPGADVAALPRLCAFLGLIFI